MICHRPIKKIFVGSELKVILSELDDALEFCVLIENQTLVRFVVCKFKYVGIVHICWWELEIEGIYEIQWMPYLIRVISFA